MNTSSLRKLHSLMEPVRKFLIETLLPLYRSSRVERDLKEDATVGAMNAQIVTIERQGALTMFGNHLEAITLGNVKNIYEGLVDNFPDLSAIFLRFSFDFPSMRSIRTMGISPPPFHEGGDSSTADEKSTGEQNVGCNHVSYETTHAIQIILYFRLVSPAESPGIFTREAEVP